MEARKFRGKNIREVFENVKRELGDDALILSQKEIKNVGVEVIATSFVTDDSLSEFSPVSKSKEIFASVYREMTKADKAYEAQKTNVNNVSDFEKHSSAENIAAGITPEQRRPSVGDVTQGLDSQHQFTSHPDYSQDEEQDCQESINLTRPLEVSERTSSKVEYHVKDPTMDKLRDDLGTIRAMLQDKLDYLQVHEKFKTLPLSHMIFDKLKQFGCSSCVAEELVANLHQDWSESEAWNAVLNKLQTKIKTSPKLLPQHRGNLLLLGSSGSGKTTLLLKILVSYLQVHTNPHVAVISFDHKIGSQAMLKRFCDLLSVPVLFCDNSHYLEHALSFNQKYDLILVDSPAKWPFELHWAQQYLSKCHNPETVYTLCGSTLGAVMETNVRYHQKLFPKLAVITKQDEATSLGHCLSLALEYNLSLVGISSGDNISEGFKRLRSFELVDIAQKLFENSLGVSDKSLAGS